MTTPYNDDLKNLIVCIAAGFGDEVGTAVNEKINELLGLEGVDIAALNAQISALNAALASNTAGDQLTAQSILAQLGALDTRLDVLEAILPTLTGLPDRVAALETGLAAETQARTDAVSNLTSTVGALQSQVDSLSQTVVAIQNGGSGGSGTECDCAGILAQLAEVATDIAALEGTDAQQTALIAGLRSDVQALQAQAGAAAAALAAAQAAQASANSALQAAGAAAQAAAAAQADVDALEAVVAANEAANAAAHDGFVTKDEVQRIDCAVVIAAFRTPMRTKMGLALGQSNGTGNNG